MTDDTQPDDEMTEYEAAAIDDRLAEIEDEDKLYSTEEVADELGIDLNDAGNERAEDIKTYIDRHGVEGLVTAIDYAREYVEGKVNHRIMAREQDLDPREAAIILEALRPAVEGRDYDDARWPDDEGLPRVDPGDDEADERDGIGRYDPDEVVEINPDPDEMAGDDEE